MLVNELYTASTRARLPFEPTARTIALSSSVFENLADLDRAFEILLTKKQLAERLAFSQSFINKLMSEEALPHYRVGRAVRFRVREVVAWLQKRRQP
ncbi:MAG: helix-turn-helix domain-containing protein [Deltaproteobacteria bacterium]|nr:helix-turn-helix domain-containing protein [Deltaproteobacteria bacterium]